MNNKLIKGIVIAIALMLALVFMLGKQDSDSDSDIGQRIYPDLSSRIEVVDKVSITSSDSQVTIMAGDGEIELFGKLRYAQ
jgi:hypothetical protein